MAGDDRHLAVDAGLPDRRRDVRAGNPDAPALVERDRIRGSELAERLAVAERQAALQREPRDRPVHRTRVEVSESEPLGEPPRDRALSCPRGAVDGNDHALSLRESATVDVRITRCFAAIQLDEVAHL